MLCRREPVCSIVYVYRFYIDERDRERTAPCSQRCLSVSVESCDSAFMVASILRKCEVCSGTTRFDKIEFPLLSTFISILLLLDERSATSLFTNILNLSVCLSQEYEYEQMREDIEVVLMVFDSA